MLQFPFYSVAETGFHTKVCWGSIENFREKHKKQAAKYKYINKYFSYNIVVFI